MIRKFMRQIKYRRHLLKTVKRSYDDAVHVISSVRCQDYPVFEQDNRLDIQYDLMIVLPVYNAGEYLDKCLRSVLDQKTSYTYHVVAVNDGSTDGSADVLKRYESDKRITVIHQENRGHSGARNRALETIIGRYVMFVDADDYLPEHAVEALLNTAFECDADLVAGGYSQFNDDKGIFDTVTYGTVPQKVPALCIPSFACMKVLRAELMKDFCLPSGMVFEDSALLWLVFPFCVKSYTVPDVVYYYRKHAGGFSENHHMNPISIDAYWITRYCLEEAARREYVLDSTMYEQYLRQCWVNYLRTQYMSEDVQESIFVATAVLYDRYFGDVKLQTSDKKLKWLHRALKKRSYAAYLFLMKRWEIL